MQAYQERVVVEKCELSEKLDKLRTFWGGSLFETLPEQERERLTRQMMVMSEYVGILSERIAAFEASNAA